MKLEDAFVKVVWDHYEATGDGIDEDELIRKVEEMAITDVELQEDIEAENQHTLRLMGQQEARSRKRYIAKESQK